MIRTIHANGRGIVWIVCSVNIDILSADALELHRDVI